MNRTPPPNRTWRTVDGVVLKVWAPPPGAPLLAICWWPLQHAIRWMGLAGVHDLLHLDEVRFVGVVRRSSLPDVFIYLHDRTLRELYVDDTGMTYRLRPLRKEPMTPRGVV